MGVPELRLQYLPTRRIEATEIGDDRGVVAACLRVGTGWRVHAQGCLLAQDLPCAWEERIVGMRHCWHSEQGCNVEAACHVLHCSWLRLLD